MVGRAALAGGMQVQLRRKENRVNWTKRDRSEGTPVEQILAIYGAEIEAK